MTSAPMSPSSIVQRGPARTREKSITLKPRSGRAFPSVMAESVSTAGLFVLFGQHLFVLLRRAPPPRSPVGPHPHGLPALAALAPVVSDIKPLGLAIGGLFLAGDS